MFPKGKLGDHLDRQDLQGQNFTFRTTGKYNSRITLPREKSVVTKNIASNICDDFCLNTMRVKHREGQGNARQVVRGV